MHLLQCVDWLMKKLQWVAKKMWLYLRAKTASIFCASIASEKGQKLVLPFEGSSTPPQPTLKTDSNKKSVSIVLPRS